MTTLRNELAGMLMSASLGLVIVFSLLARASRWATAASANAVLFAFKIAFPLYAEPLGWAARLLQRTAMKMATPDQRLQLASDFSDRLNNHTKGFSNG